MIERPTIALRLDSDELGALLDDVERLLAASSPWLRYLASRALDGLQEGVQLVCVDGDDAAATRTGDVRILAKPAKDLLRLVAALRAGNGDPEVWIRLQGELHEGASRG